jgi:hypothetical protein
MVPYESVILVEIHATPIPTLLVGIPTCLTTGGATYSLCATGRATFLTTSGATYSSSSISLLLLVTTCICWPLGITPRTTFDVKIYPFLSIYETNRTILLQYGTHNTFDTLDKSLDSNQNDTVPYPCTACLTSMPISTHKFDLVSVKVLNNSLTPFIWKYAPLCTN